MNNKKPGIIERFFAWLFEPVNDIVEDATDSIAEKVRMEKRAIKKLDFIKKVVYIINSIPAAPLLRSMRNPVGFCFYRGFIV